MADKNSEKGPRVGAPRPVFGTSSYVGDGWAASRRGLGRALIITRREVRDQLRDWRIVLPILTLAVFFPFLMTFLAQQAIDFAQAYGGRLIGDRLIPFLLMVVGFFPTSVSLVIALESFVGEKERNSLEPLLTAPLTEGQLYLGKLMAAMAAPLTSSFLGIAVYLVSLHFALGWRAEPALLGQLALLTTVQAVVMVSSAVVISSQTTSVRAANLLASFIIIPMALLVQGEALVMFWGRYDALWWIILGLATVDVVLIRMGVRLFNREELLGREIDEFNPRWAWRVFRRSFLGEARSVKGWYRGEVFPAVRRLSQPVLAMSLTAVVGYLLGAAQAERFRLPPQILSLDAMGGDFAAQFADFGLLAWRGVATIFLHNVRAILLATVLGVFSLGVMSTIVLALPLALAGYFAASLAGAGESPWTFLAAFILPHGSVEIPAAILSGAAILRLGASLLAAPSGTSVGETWLRALADWARVFLGVVLPLLLLAAALEVFLTPQVVVAVFAR